MSFPVKSLPVIQNWDCHVCGTCCKEYRVTLTTEEKNRLEAQGWDIDRDLGGLRPFVRHGPFWHRQWQLNHRSDGSCVFLSENGRCRVHERHGYDTKPLPCRLFPFVLVPQGDHWGVSVRYACPSAAENRGRPVPEHEQALREFAQQLALRENLTPRPDGTLLKPPLLQTGQRVDWSDLELFVQALLRLLNHRPDPFERRMRKCLTLASLCRQSKFDTVTGKRLQEFLHLISRAVDGDTPVDPASLQRPSWLGRLLFRQALALYSRKDHGPNRGPSMGGRLSLLGVAVRFIRGKGTVPRLHAWLPETTFETVEHTPTNLTPEAEEMLRRYYTVKVASMQFCGTTSFGMSFWEGFEHLALTLPILLWLTRAFAPLPADKGLARALSIVDDHFGFNRVLGTLRQRIGFKLLASRGETTRLIAWYSR